MKDAKVVLNKWLSNVLSSQKLCFSNASPQVISESEPNKITSFSFLSERRQVDSTFNMQK